MGSESFNPYKMAQQQFDAVAEKLGLGSSRYELVEI